MKSRVFTVMSALLIASCLVGCSDNSVSTVASDADTSYVGNDAAEQINEYLADKVILFDTSASLENRQETTVYVVAENTAETGEFTNVYLYSKCLGKDVICYVGNFDSHSVDCGTIIPLDIDGDDVDELLLNMEISGNGGTVTYVYSYKDDVFVQMHDLEDYVPKLICESVSDRKLKVRSSLAEFQVVLTIADVYGDSIKNLQFDADGITQHSFDANADPIYHIAVVDGKVVCTMPFEIDHIYCYDIQQTLKFDPDTREFVVCSYELTEINSER